MVSVVLPIYNISEQDLCQCLGSLQRQTHSDFEVLMSDAEYDIPGTL